MNQAIKTICKNAFQELFKTISQNKNHIASSIIDQVFFQLPVPQLFALLRLRLNARLCKCTNIMKSTFLFWLFFRN